MSKIKYGLWVLCVIGLLIIGVPQLNWELSLEMESIFSILWLFLAVLVLIANWRRLLKFDLLQRYQEEGLRRKKWLEAHRQLRKLNQQHRRNRRGMLAQR